MNKAPIQTQNCDFICASCGSNFNIKVMMNQPTYGIDVCSHCHPFYIGKTANVKLRGRSEKLSSKFDVGKEFISHKHLRKDKIIKVKEVKGFDSL